MKGLSLGIFWFLIFFSILLQQEEQPHSSA